MGTGAQELRIAYLGPPGSFSHEAARKAFPDGNLESCPTIEGVFRAVALRRSERGLVPIENSIGGAVAPTLDGLLENGELTIQAELILDVEQCLVSRCASLDSIERVYSHPQGLEQCRRWLAANLPEAELVPEASTSHAAARAATEPSAAAISSRLAAHMNGREVLRADIQTAAANKTRFLVLGPEPTVPTGRDRTSLMFTSRHECGALRRALEVFDAEGINLTSIVSRPSGDLWEYVFFVDVEGHALDPALSRALETLRTQCPTVALLGSYARA